jgi:alpha-1,2-mannosyltransferase
MQPAEDDVNKTDVSTCDYLIDLDFPLHPSSSAHEPRYTVNEAWEKVVCTPFLDGRHSMIITRMLWIPGERWQKGNEWGEYCLLKNTERIAEKEARLKV